MAGRTNIHIDITTTANLQAINSLIGSLTRLSAAMRSLSTTARTGAAGVKSMDTALRSVNKAAASTGSAGTKGAAGLNALRTAATSANASFTGLSAHMAAYQAAMTATAAQTGQLVAATRQQNTSLTALGRTLTSLAGASRTVTSSFTGVATGSRTMSSSAVSATSGLQRMMNVLRTLTSMLGNTLRSGFAAAGNSIRAFAQSGAALFANLQRAVQSTGGIFTQFSRQVSDSMNNASRAIRDFYNAGFSMLVSGRMMGNFGESMFSGMSGTLDQYMQYEQGLTRTAISAAVTTGEGQSMEVTVDPSIIQDLVFGLQRGTIGEAPIMQFDAKELAEGLYYYTSAIGQPVTRDNMEDVGGVVSSIMQMAAVTRTGLETATKGVVNAALEFGIDPRDTANADEIQRIAAQMGYLANISTMEVPDIAETFKMVGPMAHILSGDEAGSGLNEMFAMTFLASEMGLRGGNVGRGVGQGLTTLLDPTKKALGVAAEAFGIEASEEAWKAFFFDAEGRLEGGLPGLFEKIGTIPEADQVAFLAELFTTNATRSLIAINESLKKAGGWDAMMEEIAIAGENPERWLSEAAAATNDTIFANMQNVRNAWFAIMAEIVDGIAEPLKRVLKMVADIFWEISDVVNQNPWISRLIVGIGALVATITTAIGAALMFGGSILLLMKAFSMLGGMAHPFLLFFLTLGRSLLLLTPIMLALAAAGTLLAAAWNRDFMGIQTSLTNLYENFDFETMIEPQLENVAEALRFTGKAFSEFVNGVLGGFGSTMVMGRWLEEVFGPILGPAFYAQLLRARDALDGFRDGLRDFFSGANTEGFVGGIRAAMGTLQGFFEMLVTGRIQDQNKIFANALGDALGIDNMAGIMVRAVRTTRDGIANIIAAIQGLSAAIAPQLATIRDSMSEVFDMQTLRDVGTFLREFALGFAAGVAAVGVSVVSLIAHLSRLIASLGSVGDAVGDFVLEWTGVQLTLDNVGRAVGVLTGLIVGGLMARALLPFTGLLVTVSGTLLKVAGAFALFGVQALWSARYMVVWVARLAAATVAVTVMAAATTVAAVAVGVWNAAQAASIAVTAASRVVMMGLLAIFASYRLVVMAASAAMVVWRAVVTATFAAIVALRTAILTVSVAFATMRASVAVATLTMGIFRAASLLTAQAARNLLTGLGSLVTSFARAAASATMATGAFLANAAAQVAAAAMPILIVAGLALLGAAFYAAYQRSEEFRAAISTIGSVLGSVIMPAVTIIVGGLVLLGKAIFDVVTNVGFWTSAFDGIVSVITGVVSHISQFEAGLKGLALVIVGALAIALGAGVIAFAMFVAGLILAAAQIALVAAAIGLAIYGIIRAFEWLNEQTGVVDWFVGEIGASFGHLQDIMMLGWDEVFQYILARVEAGLRTIQIKVLSELVTFVEDLSTINLPWGADIGGKRWDAGHEKVAEKQAELDAANAQILDIDTRATAAAEARGSALATATIDGYTSAIESWDLEMGDFFSGDMDLDLGSIKTGIMDFFGLDNLDLGSFSTDDLMGAMNVDEFMNKYATSIESAAGMNLEDVLMSKYEEQKTAWQSYKAMVARLGEFGAQQHYLDIGAPIPSDPGRYEDWVNKEGEGMADAAAKFAENVATFNGEIGNALKSVSLETAMTGVFGGDSVGTALVQVGDQILQNIGDAGPWLNMTELVADAAGTGLLGGGLDGRNLHEALGPALQIVAEQTGMSINDIMKDIPKYIAPEEFVPIATAELAEGLNMIGPEAFKTLDTLGTDWLDQAGVPFEEYGIEWAELNSYAIGKAVAGQDWNLAMYLASSWGVSVDEAEAYLISKGLNANTITSSWYEDTQMMAAAMGGQVSLITDEWYNWLAQMTDNFSDKTIELTQDTFNSLPDYIKIGMSNMGYTFVVGGEQTAAQAAAGAQAIVDGFRNAWGGGKGGFRQVVGDEAAGVEEGFVRIRNAAGQVIDVPAPEYAAYKQALKDIENINKSVSTSFNDARQAIIKNIRDAFGDVDGRTQDQFIRGNEEFINEAARSGAGAAGGVPSIPGVPTVDQATTIGEDLAGAVIAGITSKLQTEFTVDVFDTSVFSGYGSRAAEAFSTAFNTALSQGMSVATSEVSGGGGGGLSGLASKGWGGIGAAGGAGGGATGGPFDATFRGYATSAMNAFKEQISLDMGPALMGLSAGGSGGGYAGDAGPFDFTFQGYATSAMESFRTQLATDWALALTTLITASPTGGPFDEAFRGYATAAMTAFKSELSNSFAINNAMGFGIGVITSGGPFDELFRGYASSAITAFKEAVNAGLAGWQPAMGAVAAPPGGVGPTDLDATATAAPQTITITVTVDTSGFFTGLAPVLTTAEAFANAQYVSELTTDPLPFYNTLNPVLQAGQAFENATYTSTLTADPSPWNSIYAVVLSSAQGWDVAIFSATLTVNDQATSVIQNAIDLANDFANGSSTRTLTTINETINTTTERKAAGGVVSADYQWVGERGPEWVALPQGTRVTSSARSMQWLEKSVSATQGGEPIKLEINAASAPRADVMPTHSESFKGARQWEVKRSGGRGGDMKVEINNLTVSKDVDVAAAIDKIDRLTGRKMELVRRGMTAYGDPRTL